MPAAGTSGTASTSAEIAVLGDVPAVPDRKLYCCTTSGLPGAYNKVAVSLSVSACTGRWAIIRLKCNMSGIGMPYVNLRTWNVFFIKNY